MRVDFSKLDALGKLYLDIKTEFSKAAKEEKFDQFIFNNNLYAYYSELHEEIRGNLLIESFNINKYLDTVRVRLDMCYTELAKALKIVRCPYTYKAVAFNSNRFDDFPEKFKFIYELFDDVWRSYFLSLYMISLRLNENNEVIKEDYLNYFWGRTATLEEMTTSSTFSNLSNRLPQHLFKNHFQTENNILGGTLERSNEDILSVQERPTHRVVIFAHNFRAKSKNIQPINSKPGWKINGDNEGESGENRAKRWYTTLPTHPKYNPPTHKEIPAILNLLRDDPEALEFAKNEILSMLIKYPERLDQAKKYISDNYK